MAKRLNDTAKWIIVAIAIGGLVFNSGVLYNDVSHLKAEVKELKEAIKNIQSYLINE